MSSKKKKRHKAWLKRQEKKKLEKLLAQARNKALNSGDIEEAARAMGIKLR